MSLSAIDVLGKADDRGEDGSLSTAKKNGG